MLVCPLLKLFYYLLFTLLFFLPVDVALTKSAKPATPAAANVQNKKQLTHSKKKDSGSDSSPWEDS